MTRGTEEGRKRTAVIYARFSCDKQREESIEGQIRECKAFANAKGLNVVKCYVDEAISARTDDRPQFQKMIDDARAHLFGVVIVWKVDRFSRSRLDALKYKAILKKHNVKLISATEAISDGPEGILLESVLDGLAEYYSADLSEKVVRGMTENVINGKVIGGMRTFGYRNVDHKYVIDEQEAAIVRKIFELYTETPLTCTGIQKRFDQLGITRLDGKPFTPISIYTIVKNERYTGVLRFRDHVNVEAIPRIIDDETFQRAKAKLKKNQKGIGVHAAKNPYLLFGKCVCGYCSGLVRGYGGTSGTKGRYYSYYRCKNAVKEHICKAKSISKDKLESIALEAIHDSFDDKMNLDELCEVLYQKQFQPSPERLSLEKELEENKKNMDNIMKAIEQGALYSEFKIRYMTLQQNAEKLSQKIQSIEGNINYSKEDIKILLNEIHRLKQIDDGKKAMLLSSLIKLVVVYDDHIDIQIESMKKNVVTNIKKIK